MKKLFLGAAFIGATLAATASFAKAEGDDGWQYRWKTTSGKCNDSCNAGSDCPCMVNEA